MNTDDFHDSAVHGGGGTPSDPVTDEEKFRIWMRAWEKAAPALEEDRRARLRDDDPRDGILAFAGLVRTALRDRPAPNSSGLIEQQRLFRSGMS